MTWYLSLPPAEVAVPCGNGSHTVRWEAGHLVLPGHPDAEAELVLGALGGDKPACLTLLEKWSRHRGDLAVLTAGPRSLADQVTITRERIDEQRSRWPGVAPGRAQARPAATGATIAPVAAAHPPGPGPQRIIAARAVAFSRGMASAPGGASGHPFALMRGHMGGEDFLERAMRRFEVLELLALGAAFQFRLSGEVAAAWGSAARAGDRDAHRPTLTAALTGRLAPAAAQWLGIDPDEVTVTPHEGTGWGSITVTGTGAGIDAGARAGAGARDAATGPGGSGQLRASLPVRWLSEVWACGLAVVDGCLIVGVEEPGYPRARVLALRAPGDNPVTVDVEACAPAPDSAALPRWSILSGG